MENLLVGVVLIAVAVGGVLLVLKLLRSGFLAPVESRLGLGTPGQRLAVGVVRIVFVVACLFVATISVLYGVGEIRDAQSETNTASERRRARAALCDAVQAAFEREPPESLRTAAIRVRRAAASVGGAVTSQYTRRDPDITLFGLADDRGQRVAVMGWKPGEGIRFC